jgi:hypothetical protein
MRFIGLVYIRTYIIEQPTKITLPNPAIHGTAPDFVVDDPRDV